jgi:hypothetical protein
MREAVKKILQRMNNERLVYAAYWLGFILFILAFIFNEYVREFIRALLFIAGFLYAKHFAERRAMNYLNNFKLPGAPYQPGKILDYKLYKKSIPGLMKLIAFTIAGIFIGAWGIEDDILLLIYIGPLLTGAGAGEIFVHFKVRKIIKRSFDNL